MATYHNYVAVIGRIPFDDEDTLVMFEHTTVEDAKSAPLITDYCPNCSRLGNSSGIMEDEIEGLRSALGNAGLIIESLRQQLTSATQALELIADRNCNSSVLNKS